MVKWWWEKSNGPMLMHIFDMAGKLWISPFLWYKDLFLIFQSVIFFGTDILFYTETLSYLRCGFFSSESNYWKPIFLAKSFILRQMFWGCSMFCRFTTILILKCGSDGQIGGMEYIQQSLSMSPHQNFPHNIVLQ